MSKVPFILIASQRERANHHNSKTELMFRPTIKELNVSFSEPTSQPSNGTYHELIPYPQALSNSPDITNQDFLELKINMILLHDHLQQIIHSFRVAETSQKSPINHLPPILKMRDGLHAFSRTDRPPLHPKHHYQKPISYSGEIKKNLLREKAENENTTIITLTESHLNSGYLEGEVHMKGYGPFRADRTNEVKNGGVITYIRDDTLTRDSCIVSDSIGNIEFFVLKIKSLYALVIVMYRPPSAKTIDF